MTIDSYKTTVLSADKKGELQNAYSPLQNLVNSNFQLGDFTSQKLNFDMYTPVDMLITDEYDGSENIIINDDKNNPKLINSRFSVQENKTFNIPIHSGNAVTNVYEEQAFDKDTQLLKLYDKIPTLLFEGIFQGGQFKVGEYVFYFKLSDSDGNQTNIIQESGIIQMHIGNPKQIKIRMGMQDENSEKSIKFRLKNIDRGFDYVKIFYERCSTDESQSIVHQYYMIQQNFPIRNGKCDILLTGAEDILEIAKSDLQNEFADISSVKTQEIVDNTLFLGNISAFEQDYQELQRVSWKIIPRIVHESNIGQIQTQNYNFQKGTLYYSSENIYNNVGYWDDEFYRFGIVYIYNNNLLSPVFNIQGCDMNTLVDGSGKELPDYDLFKVFFKSDDEEWDQESEDFFFKKKYRTNSKGVIRLPQNKNEQDVLSDGLFVPNVTKIAFDLSQIHKKTPDSQSGIHYKVDGIKTPEEYLKYLGIKGFFFVRQKRIPTIIAQGMVVGLTGKDYGCIPVLKNIKGKYTTKSFIGSDRLLHDTGNDIEVNHHHVSDIALLVPDYEINEATLNQVFTGQEFCLKQESNISTEHFKNNSDYIFSLNRKKAPSYSGYKSVKLTAIPKETKLLTDGKRYFSTMVGNPNEPYKTADVEHEWDRTVPQDLTVSTSLIRGNWGSYVGMSSGGFSYGDIVNIRPGDFNDQDHDILEYEKRFKDYSFYSSISTRYNISDISIKNYKITCARGDCFKGLFTHRMMSNFIDPELPTNTRILDPACWAKNYAVRCTSEIINKTHSNLTSDSAGWYIPSPPPPKRASILSLVFSILTGNIGLAIQAIDDMKAPETWEKKPNQTQFANEIAQAFEVYVGKGSAEDPFSPAADNPLDKDDTYKNSTRSLYDAVQNGHIKKVNPQEQESNSVGLNLKAIFKPSSDSWELHGLASINRADVNAVSFGQWITFPFCSSYNLSMRDIDFSHATEEASLNRKRAFYPLEAMNPKNHLLESGVINGAAKVSLASNNHPAYTTVPYIKQEFFNRIYWSKPNVSEAFINSYRMIFSDQYREYNKEFGAITKLVQLGNSLLVIFQHGIGLLPINRNPQNEKEQSPYLSSKSVLPTQVQTLTADYGSMWKDSVIKSPYTQCVYGVDTVAKKIWKVEPQGSGLEFISDFKVQKFLNDWIDLSEYDFNEYQGHINVKTHYNEFKHDVMFTYYRDIPMSRFTYYKSDSNDYYIVPIGYVVNNDGWAYNKAVNKATIRYKYDKDSDLFGTWQQKISGWVNYDGPTNTYKQVDLSGNLILDDTLDPKPLIEKWEPGKTWNLCYNEVLKQWITFYDWNPVESCNVDNIFFSFNKDQIDEVLNNQDKPINFVSVNLSNYQMNKYFLDKAFGNNCRIYMLYPENTVSVDGKYITFYCKGEPQITNGRRMEKLQFGQDTNWYFYIYSRTDEQNPITIECDNKIYLSEIRTWDNILDENEKSNLKYYKMRDSEGNRMLLWKHGQSGLYDNQGKIKPTNWYGKQHEFNVEFIVNQDAQIQKIFNNLKVISNKTAPNKFEYEVVGEGYDWYELKPVILWINKKATDKDSFEYYYKEVLSKSYDTLRSSYPDFPELFGYEGKTIKKIPFLHLETCDKHGRKDKSYNQNTDYWSHLDGFNHNNDYAFNTSETIIVEDDQLNEQRVHTESLGNDVKKYGRLRGNMQYLEDLWDIEIRPIKFKWAYVEKDNSNEDVLKFISSKESRLRDKYLKVRIRYSGEDLAVIQGIITMFDYSMA